MNIYKVLSLNGGITEIHMIESYDIMQAIQVSGVMMANIIKIELVGSLNIVN